ncbi:hypothetical protein G6F62_004258 [Rhizopus arrhizus]|uniref:Major facilitator superfamily (MFS) profile domain-containing protein n=1 Tax=Rhizopus oryzae TaxID=64495 RepID=A0A9P7BXA9_RHIOR|nr:hypothetical protein G6F23_002189 [Rhizopus arrhizus]KAG0767105.1 hypothetical protein G6F24_003072 [Rhizopus arrhizus]KAG0797655.1 hypothetical protein G6F21_000374 [Rhizopus arrhizus]KAG0801828.1 hypothetical protein G6F22_000862 [Rhizopus arrhizus]KAG0814937.1 hypothetical protein G6F20_004385 [Rhizopus arrhizus]
MVIDNFPIDRRQYERIDSSDRTEEELGQSEEGLTSFVYTLVLSVCLGGFLFGYDTGVISGALSPLEKDFVMSIQQKEFIVGGTTFGAIFGGLSAGYPLVLCASIIFTLGSAMLAFAHSYNILLLGRLIVGVGVGVASMIIPVYIGEVAPKKFRGRLSTLNTLAVTFGQVTAYVINLVFSRTEGGWRYMFGLGALPAILQLIIMPFMPESPRRMIFVSEIEAAKHTLRRIYGYSISEEFICQEVEAIQEDMQNTNLGTYHDFLKPENFKPLIIACMLQAAQQLSGFNTVMYYAATILKMANFEDPTAVALVVAVVNMMFTIIAIFIIDKAGRRHILIVTMLFMILSLLALGGSFAIQQDWSDSKNNCIREDGQYAASTQECHNNQSTIISTMLLISLTSYVASYALGLVLVLGAGYGTRLQKDLANSTEYSHLLGIPKALLPLGNKDALITHWVELFQNHGITPASIYVVTNAQCYEQFITWAKHHNIPSDHIVSDGTSSNETRLGAVPDILFGIKHFDMDQDDVLVVGGDTLFLHDFDLEKFFDRYKELNSLTDACLVTTYSVRDDEVHKFGIVKTNSNGIITNFLEKPSPFATEARSACPCFYLFNSRSIPLIEEFVDSCEVSNAPKEAYDATGKCIAYLHPRFKIGTFRISGRIDVGGLTSYIDANKYFEAHHKQY